MAISVAIVQPARIVITVTTEAKLWSVDMWTCLLGCRNVVRKTYVILVREPRKEIYLYGYSIDPH
jgi:hypothetical protein